jgi:hypothetical protein
MLADRDPDRRQPHPHRRRPRLSRPQRPARPQVQGLYLRPEAPPHRDHQTRTPPPPGSRARDRTRQGRAPHGPKLSCRDERRPRQRRPRRRRLQLPTPAGMAGSSIVHNPGRAKPHAQSGKVAQTHLKAFFTDDFSLSSRAACKVCLSCARSSAQRTIFGLGGVFPINDGAVTIGRIATGPLCMSFCA